MSDPTEWLDFASEDLRMAELAFSEKIYNQVCFHSQQCCEKALKAWLLYQGINPPRTHQLSVLLSLSPRDIFTKLGGDIVRIDRFYIPIRYPDAPPGSLSDGLPDKTNADEALSTAKQVFRRVEQNIGV
ncbi:MAG: hypothetical protein MAG431_01998 [Chloroflexi bacterium]|nr:hypothetical protein [Chloroflexota bacterium]